MSKKKRSVLHEIYKYDKEENAFIIEVDLDNYKEIFNEWDYSPFKRRDIEPEFRVYLEECASDIPREYSLILRLHLPKEVRDPKTESEAKIGLQNYFGFMIALEKKSMFSIRRKAAQYGILAMFFLTMAYLMEHGQLSLPIKILKEGIFVGGWVFAWEVFSILFFDSREVKKKEKVYNRFLNSGIQFDYGEKKSRLDPNR